MKAGKTTFLLRTDEDTKEKASKIYQSIGMNLTTAINIFLRQTVIQKKFPCTIDTSALPDVRSTYPEGFFELFGSGKDSGFDEEPEELPMDQEEIEL